MNCTTGVPCTPSRNEVNAGDNSPTAAVNAGVPLFEYSASEIKKAVVGYGQAEKEQVRRMQNKSVAINILYFQNIRIPKHREKTILRQRY